MRPWVTGGLILLACAGVFRLGASYLERRITARIDSAAKSLGVTISYERLRVGLFPPFRITDLVIERPGQANARIKSVSVTPRFRGPRGFGLLARVRMDTAVLTLPAEMEATLKPMIWEVDPAHSLTLKSPVEGLTLTRGAGPRGRTFDLKASELNLDALATLAVEGARSQKLGAIDGGVHVEGDPRSNFQATWRFTAFGGDTGGSLIVIPGAPNAKTQLQALAGPAGIQRAGVGHEGPAHRDRTKTLGNVQRRSCRNLSG